MLRVFTFQVYWPKYMLPLVPILIHTCTCTMAYVIALLARDCKRVYYIVVFVFHIVIRVLTFQSRFKINDEDSAHLK